MQRAKILHRLGNKLTEMSADTFGFRVSGDIDIVRSDLCHILYRNIKDVECMFGDFIKALSQNSENVRFEHLGYLYEQHRLFGTQIKSKLIKTEPATPSKYSKMFVRFVD
jgi:hypothetical protein